MKTLGILGSVLFYAGFVAVGIVLVHLAALEYAAGIGRTLTP